MILVDVHEDDRMKSFVREEADEIEVADGFGADYVAGGMLIERKRWQELPGRITTSERSLRWQLDRTCTVAEEEGLEPALLVEGKWGEPFTHSQLPVETAERYLDRLHREGIRLLVTSCMPRTAELLARVEQDEEEDPRPVRDAPNVPEGLVPRYLVEGLRGVGPKTAMALLDEFGSARDVFAASEEELQRVHGVGEKTAERIVRDLKSQS